MSIKFKEMQQQEAIMQKLLKRYGKTADSIQAYNASDAEAIRHIAEDLHNNWKDFTRDERKLNLAVVGRVKAGKSTFLNTIVFGGQHILPEAFTPKTATLTKIEYAETNSLEIEYYSSEEWKELEHQAKSSEGSDAAKAAKELTESVKASGVNVSAILRKGAETETFASENELMGRLNRYVGENGEITPLVKCVTLKINKAELDGISIVDTPGLNDPVISRTQKTRDFLGLCDVVFFLSPASQFLDKNDVDLLRAQLPQKGVARLILICSRFDDALVDAIYDVDSLEEAIDEVKSALNDQAKSIFGKQASEYSKAGNSAIASLLSECESPIFVSSLFHNMLSKPSSSYNAAEDNAFDNLNTHDDLDDEMMETIGDIRPVETRLGEVIRQKDSVLAKKAQGFVPLAENNLIDHLAAFKAGSIHRLNQIEGSDKNELERQQKSLQSKIHTIQARMEEYFGTVINNMNRTKLEIVHDLRQTINEYSGITTRSLTETKRVGHKVSDSILFLPWTWGDSHTEYTYYTETHTYVDVNDAIENIRGYGRKASNEIETGFMENADIADLKPKLIRTVLESMDTSDENFDPAYFKLLAEKTVQQINIPVLHISVDGFINSLSNSFGSYAVDYQVSSFRQQFGNTMSSLFNHICTQFEAETNKFNQQMNDAKDNFANQLLKNINEDFEEIKRALDEREKSSRALRSYIDLLNNMEKE